MATSIRLLSALLNERGVLALLVTSQLLAFIYTLAGNMPFWQSLGLTSLFIHFTAFCALAILSLLKRFCERLPDWQEAILVISVFVSCSAITSLVVPIVFALLGFIDDSSFTLDVGRNMAICIAVITLFVHFLAIYRDNIGNVQALSEAELIALQARIRPHFLYNALNMVAELCHVDSKAAEQAALNLAELSKAAMANKAAVTLNHEIALCQSYIELEKWRFAERLRVTWQVESGLDEQRIPSLILQPLLENAVIHGVEPSPNGADIEVTIAINAAMLCISVKNSFNPELPLAHQGHGIGLDNIRRRLHLQYGQAVDFTAQPQQDSFIVHFKIPLSS
ncbi:MULTISPECIES: sensor histidine kinase [unclassified Pseudoalteromonas]|uniref:sensor histidine kinase n=1 Tax=unclassified Pseudoalteromonas TaxID=194690 RepID=UPI00301510F3